MKKVRICLFSIIVFLLSLLGSMSLIYASNDVKGDIRIVLTNLGTNVSGVTFKLYRVGTVESGVPKLNTQYGYSFYPETGEALDNLAKELSSKVTVAESYAGTVDNQGKLEIAGIEDGVYLVVAQGTDTYGKISPFMLNLPYMDDISHALTWVADIEPKASPNSTPTVVPTTPEPTKTPEEPTPTEAPEDPEEPEEPTPTSEPVVEPTQVPGETESRYTEATPTPYTYTDNTAYNYGSGETSMYSTSAVSTGDNTPIAVNIILLVSSIAFIGYVIRKRKEVK